MKKQTIGKKIVELESLEISYRVAESFFDSRRGDFVVDVDEFRSFIYFQILSWSEKSNDAICKRAQAERIPTDLSRRKEKDVIRILHFLVSNVNVITILRNTCERKKL